MGPVIMQKTANGENTMTKSFIIFSGLEELHLTNAIFINAIKDNVNTTTQKIINGVVTTRLRESANKQVMSSQADSLIKISRIWADFFPANTSNQPI
ncbi:hypothetical protein ACKLNS_10135 [Enterobacter hormaechei]|uniref:hypothetical protein n=1 Tax=Enterobacter hormaechei TaxID=158836 RepID=UPI0038D4D17E